MRVSEGDAVPGFVQGAELGYARCEGEVFEGFEFCWGEGVGLEGELFG